MGVSIGARSAFVDAKEPRGRARMPVHMIEHVLTRRPSRLWAVSAFVVLASAAAAVVSAAPRPSTLAAFCSPSGDVCFGVINRSGAVYLELSTAVHYFDRYRLCLRPPRGGAAGRLRCGVYPVVRRGAAWGSSIKFSRQFPNVGPGTYRATWKLDAQPLGPTLHFQLPLNHRRP
jgi:hypothetical protein